MARQLSVRENEAWSRRYRGARSPRTEPEPPEPHDVTPARRRKPAAGLADTGADVRRGTRGTIEIDFGSARRADSIVQTRLTAPQLKARSHDRTRAGPKPGRMWYQLLILACGNWRKLTATTIGPHDITCDEQNGVNRTRAAFRRRITESGDLSRSKPISPGLSTWLAENPAFEEGDAEPGRNGLAEGAASKR